MECVGHIQKCLGKRLCELKKKTLVDDSSQVRKIKWGGKGCLTESVINVSLLPSISQILPNILMTSSRMQRETC